MATKYLGAAATNSPGIVSDISSDEEEISQNFDETGQSKDFVLSASHKEFTTMSNKTKSTYDEKKLSAAKAKVEK